MTDTSPTWNVPARYCPCGDHNFTISDTYTDPDTGTRRAFLFLDGVRIADIELEDVIFDHTIRDLNRHFPTVNVYVRSRDVEEATTRQPMLRTHVGVGRRVDQVDENRDGDWGIRLDPVGGVYHADHDPLLLAFPGAGVADTYAMTL